MADSRLYTQARETTLFGSGVTSTAVSATLSQLVDPQGNLLTMADFGTVGYGVFEPSTEREENFSFTDITQNANGTALVTGITRGLKFVADYTQDITLREAHAGSTPVIISNSAPFYNNFANKHNDETVAEIWTFTNPNYPKMDSAVAAPVDDEELATKKYVDDTAAGGSVSVTAIIVSATAGENVAAGELVYLDETDNEWKLANAGVSATSDNVQLGITQGAGTDGNTIAGGVLLEGRDINQAGLTQGDKLFATDVSGVIGAAAGTVEVEVGHAVNATSLDFSPKFASFTTKLQRNALAGTSGTPDTGNEYVTDDDTAVVAAADKVVRANGSNKIDNDWLNFSPTESVTSGDTITGATTPQPVYQDDGTGKFLRCDANDTAAMKYLGMAITSGNDTDAITVQFTGVVPGFAGLTAGEKYYVQDAVGTVGTSPGTNEVLVGVAVSATQIMIQKGARYASGNVNSTVTTLTSTTTITTGFRVSSVNMFAGSSVLTGGGGDVFVQTSGKWTVAGGNDCVSAFLGSGYSIDNTKILSYLDASADSWTAEITNITDTSFDIDFVGDASHSGGNMAIVWQAIGEL